MALTRKFNEVYADYNVFKSDAELYLSENYLTDTELEILYILFYNQFSEQSLNVRDPLLWKRRFWTKIAFRSKKLFKKRDLMEAIYNLTLEEMEDKGVSVMNTALNPNTKPTDPFQVIDFITQQSSTKSLNPKIVALLAQYQSMDDKFWDEFFGEFDRDLFLQVFGNSFKYILWEDEQ